MRRLLLPLALLLALAPGATAAPEPLSLAVASSAAEAMTELAHQWKAKGHAEPRVTSGATGTFYSQILAGAPFDLLFTADTTTTARLMKAGLGERETRYASGTLVLWSASGLGLAALGTPAVRHVAIANPAVAPYGAAAVAVLKTRPGLYEQVRPKLVQTKDAALVAATVLTGAAEAGFLPASVARSPKLMGKGRAVALPMAKPLEQSALVLLASRQRPEARSFLSYVTSPAADATWTRFGFQPAPHVRR